MPEIQGSSELPITMFAVVYCKKYFKTISPGSKGRQEVKLTCILFAFCCAMVSWL